MWLFRLCFQQDKKNSPVFDVERRWLHLCNKDFGPNGLCAFRSECETPSCVAPAYFAYPVIAEIDYLSIPFS